LAELGVDAVTLANNHTLDYGPDALLDTLAHLDVAGIAAVGAGADQRAARAPRIVTCGALRLRLVAFADHPAEYAAGPSRPGVAYVDLRGELPDWALAALRPGADADCVLAMPPWGPNMVPEPLPYIRRAADALLDAGASLVAGHSAHVFQGMSAGVLFDLGDFLDDYAVDPLQRNDLGLLWLIELDPSGPGAVRALPLALEYAFTRRASPPETEQIARLLSERCAPFATEVRVRDGMIELSVASSGARSSPG
jgi:poly-gamma-glutamate synthesis protein (capsule biosynthesis protein)